MKYVSVFFLLLVSVIFFNGAIAKEIITASGSSTVHEIVHEASGVFKQLHPEVQFIVGAGGSKKGIKA